LAIRKKIWRRRAAELRVILKRIGLDGLISKMPPDRYKSKERNNREKRLEDTREASFNLLTPIKMRGLMEKTEGRVSNRPIYKAKHG
jgi:hypothetical protein